MTDIGDLITQVAEQTVEPLPALVFTSIYQESTSVKFLGCFTTEELAKERCERWIKNMDPGEVPWKAVSENIWHYDFPELRRVLVVRQKVSHTLPPPKGEKA